MIRLVLALSILAACGRDSAPRAPQARAVCDDIARAVQDTASCRDVLDGAVCTLGKKGAVLWCGFDDDGRPETRVLADPTAGRAAQQQQQHPQPQPQLGPMETPRK